MSETAAPSNCSCAQISCEKLELALSYLMSRFAVSPDKQVARAVLHHLEILVENINADLHADKKDHYLRLYNMWYMDVYEVKEKPCVSKELH